MLKRYVNKQRMLVAVLDFLTTNLLKLTFSPTLPGLVNELKDTEAEIRSTQEAQLKTSKGQTKSKKALKKKLITGLMEIIRSAKGYAVGTKDVVLENDLNYKPYQLEAMPMQTLAEVSKSVLKICTENAIPMAGYELTTIMLDTTTDDLDLYTKALPGTKRAIAARKTATDQIPILFAKADKQLDDIDVMMAISKTKEPLFFQEFDNLRAIDDLRGKGKIASTDGMGIMGTASNLETGRPAPGALVMAEGTTISVLTDANGRYTLKLDKEGSYALKAILNGSNTYDETGIEVTAGQYTVVDFDMEPSN